MRRGAGWQPSGKRTHLLYEIISNQIQHRMSPVWRHSGEAGLQGGGGRVWERVDVIFSRRHVGSSSQLYPFHVFIVSLHLCLQLSLAHPLSFFYITSQRSFLKHPKNIFKICEHFYQKIRSIILSLGSFYSGTTSKEEMSVIRMEKKNWS